MPNAWGCARCRETSRERVGAVRDAAGPDHNIAVDIHARYFEVQRAIRCSDLTDPLSSASGYFTVRWLGVWR